MNVCKLRDWKPAYLEVVKRSDNFYGVYKTQYNQAANRYVSELLTSATTKNQAYKKAKLIRRGYKMGYADGYN